MKNLTVSKVAAKIGLSPRQIEKLCADGKIKARKLDPDIINSPYVITEQALKDYQKAPKTVGRAAKRCEACQHPLKKTCASCERHICIRDYRKTESGLPAAKCKDCENTCKRLNSKK